MEIATADDLAAIGEHERIVCGRVQLSADDLVHEVDSVVHNAVNLNKSMLSPSFITINNLRNTTQCIRILHTIAHAVRLCRVCNEMYAF